jgi:hypothetical protein
MRRYSFMPKILVRSNGLPLSCGPAALAGTTMLLRFPCGGTVSLQRHGSPATRSERRPHLPCESRSARNLSPNLASRIHTSHSKGSQ